MAKVAKKAWPWPGLAGFTRPHFPGKLGQKPGKPGLARLCQAGRVFDCAPDAREAFQDRVPAYVLPFILTFLIALLKGSREISLSDFLPSYISRKIGRKTEPSQYSRVSAAISGMVVNLSDQRFVEK